eukprot:15315123-Heterocapsa_arctica.AAC.1
MVAIRRMRGIKAGHAGVVGGLAYQHALHEMMNGTEEDRDPPKDRRPGKRRLPKPHRRRSPRAPHQQEREADQ